MCCLQDQTSHPGNHKVQVHIDGDGNPQLLENISDIMSKFFLSLPCPKRAVATKVVSVQSDLGLALLFVADHLIKLDFSIYTIC